MSPNETIRLLIVNDSRSEVERLLSMLRNAGVPNRAQHVESEEALSKLLQEQSWDLLIGHESTNNLPIVSAIRTIKRLNKDVPVISMTEEEGSQSVVKGLKAGATEVVELDQDQHLLLVIQRELANREHRQTRRLADRKMLEAERRAQRLLDNSRDAIAYVQDGMFLYANQSFAERMGYTERDDVECMPIIDMVSDDDQENIKAFFKKFSLQKDSAETAPLQFSAITESNDPVSITTQISLAMYEEEPCIQMLVTEGGVQNALTSNTAVDGLKDTKLRQHLEHFRTKDTTTGLANRNSLLESLEKALDNATSKDNTHALLLMSIADFDNRIVDTLGIRHSELAIKELANRIHEFSDKSELLARFNDSTLALVMINCNANSALERGEALNQFINDSVIEVKGKTVQLRFQIGIGLITEATTKVDQVVEYARKAQKLLREGDSDNTGGVKLYEPEESNDDHDKSMALKLKTALNEDRFRLLFQPIISLRGSEEEKYEVLLRMVDKNGQEISPSDFLDVAREMEMINKVDRWVVLESVKVLSDHREKGNQTKLIINLSEQALLDDTLPGWLKVALKAADLPPDAVIFQIQESHVSSHINHAKHFVKSIQNNGGVVSVTNFGCTLNPMNNLKHVPFDYVKVDGSYTRELQENTESTGLTSLVKQLHELKKITIVPFVENATELSKLWQAGVHYIQGHYLQEPHSQMDYDFNSDG
ncbi:EAL domain-containing protein [Marinibactrum halimedae]|uniref:Protein FimX n=1 Tax=Marinibactrum halimedae TaxID=1444977 RepID=A0AA37T6E5_9GAMM|nr:EAL domain-containing protein [Marinibactrum halimedae]MCD9460254.1 EAL domain-containing protein [Marinibactrum halimedae]GLS24340.1 protein FimX [Marinibactrum halimedae]